MRLHKLVIFAMLLALLSILAVPTLTLAREYHSEQYTLEPLDGRSASMRDMAGPGLQFLTTKSKSSTSYAAGSDVTAAPPWSSYTRAVLPKTEQAKGFNQTDRTRPLWLMNQALLI